VAEAILRAVDGAVARGRIYECGGPETRTLQELVQYVLDVTERKRVIVPLPNALGRAQGTVMGFLNTVTLGLLPSELVMTRDQALLLEKDNVVSEEAVRDGRTLSALGIVPTSFEAIAPAYLRRYRKTGQFDLKRSTAPASE